MNKTTYDRCREEGLKQGIQEGAKEGQREARIEILQELLANRFGAISPVTAAHLRQLSNEQLKQLILKTNSVGSIAELGLPQ